ncbi:F-box protein interaction domain protein [Medicago truncatula]|uniref:F-box protein interaction domain protein n=2 Tax=Medicago truncatula TaxID=3880 RepID=G7JE92_MEDTR|nr:F-box protein interaction domain protein [Medicago truncatula]
MRGIDLPDDLIVEVLSLLPVKSLLQLKCVNKSWNSLISDPKFVKLHLQLSTPNRNLALVQYDRPDCRVLTFPLNHLLHNPSTTIPTHQFICKDNIQFQVIGSCHGLICLLRKSYTSDHTNIHFRFWNPATRVISKELGSFQQSNYHAHDRHRYIFGYDNFTGSYKVVLMCSGKVKIFNIGDNIWTEISSFPRFDHDVSLGSDRVNNGVYLNGTVNWIAFQDDLSCSTYSWMQRDTTLEQYMIILLDLGTETYKQLQPPRGDGVNLVVPRFEPTIAVLMDCLCFSHYVKRTHFIIWKMTKFGFEQSWTQFLKISFQNLQVDNNFSDWNQYQTFMFPLCLSENGETLILASSLPGLCQVILYNLRRNRVERTKDLGRIWSFAKDYVESLASIR